MSPYRGIDHVVIRLQSVEALHALFAQTFGLPVSWPLQHSPFASFGWVNVGNTNLEFWAAAQNDDLPQDAQPPLVHGFALDPGDLGASVALLAARGIACKTPKPFRTQTSECAWVTNFTNAVVLDVSSDACCVFFCEWDAEGTIYPWKEKLDAAQRNARDKAAFDACGGGPLGIVGVREVRLAVPDVDEAGKAWRALTGSDGADAIALTPDVSLRLLPRGTRGSSIETLTFGVRSLPVAKAFLAPRQLLEASPDGELRLSRAACDGLDLRLVEAGA